MREAKERPTDFHLGDTVLGEFLGELDLLVVDHSGRVLIAEPVYCREEWPVAAPTLTGFFAAFLDSRGEKFWEVQPRY
ncbi:hypothetical protein GCM10009633_19160 [Janibacter melonis]